MKKEGSSSLARIAQRSGLLLKLHAASLEGAEERAFVDLPLGRFAGLAGLDVHGDGSTKAKALDAKAGRVARGAVGPVVVLAPLALAEDHGASGAPEAVLVPRAVERRDLVSKADDLVALAAASAATQVREARVVLAALLGGSLGGRRCSGLLLDGRLFFLVDHGDGGRLLDLRWQGARRRRVRGRGGPEQVIVVPHWPSRPAGQRLLLGQVLDALLLKLRRRPWGHALPAHGGHACLLLDGVALLVDGLAGARRTAGVLFRLLALEERGLGAQALELLLGLARALGGLLRFLGEAGLLLLVLLLPLPALERGALLGGALELLLLLLLDRAPALLLLPGGVRILLVSLIYVVGGEEALLAVNGPAAPPVDRHLLDDGDAVALLEADLALAGGLELVEGHDDGEGHARVVA
mmetsp:Transcript_14902/g.47444  ORF Transcript_14902/g.47444 Transcript_14902/m.47444 type:complete len:410 (-) Transcript_14902:281-1510(-)